MKKNAGRLCFLALLLSLNLYAQNDSCNLRISVLTCAPGEELYSLFGHSAIRITSDKYTDIVFNYGTFDFNDPGFYTKFVRGQMDFFLSPSTYEDFMQEYRQEKRSVVEQELNLTCTEKQRLFNALEENMQPNNRMYQYDILFDNCTTRIGDLLQKHVQGFSITKPLTPPGTTYRNLIHNYLDLSGSPWSKLGIDILLGNHWEKKVSIHESMFLPDYTQKALDSATAAGRSNMVLAERTLLQAAPLNHRHGKYTPLLVTTLLLLLVLGLSQVRHSRAQKTLRITDSLLLYCTGLAGLLILFLWLGRADIICRNNYNLFWALPTNFIAAFFSWKKPLWLRKYFLYAAFLQAGLLLLWWALPQQLNLALVPLVALLAYRYFQLSKH